MITDEQLRQLLEYPELGQHGLFREVSAELLAARADSRRLDRIGGMGDLGCITVDSDLPGEAAEIVWNSFGLDGVPKNIREAIDLYVEADNAK